MILAYNPGQGFSRGPGVILVPRLLEGVVLPDVLLPLGVDAVIPAGSTLCPP